MATMDVKPGAVESARAGDVEAFEPLVRTSAPRVIRFAYHFLGNWEEARDLAQEAFARAYLCLDRYDRARPFDSWILTIAARLATDRLRRQRVQARAHASLRRAAEPGQQGADLVSVLSLKEALDRLTQRQREAVVLCDLHGFTAAEAASMIGCSGSTVRVLRFLARRRLRELLGAPASGDEASVESLATEANE